MSVHREFSLDSEGYRRHRPRYPAGLFDHLAGMAPGHKLAWDCGCGNGQASVALAERFDRVEARDLSDQQIARAERRHNIHYRVGPAEIIDAPDGSVDLIVAAQALHWFDRRRFFAEAERSLGPGGLLAVWGYRLICTDSPLDQRLGHLHSEVLGPYWPPGRELLDTGYAGVAFPFPREVMPEFVMEARWDLEDLLAYLNTWSAVKRFAAARGYNPVERERPALRELWDDPAQRRRVYWPLALYVGRRQP